MKHLIVAFGIFVAVGAWGIGEAQARCRKGNKTYKHNATVCMYNKIYRCNKKRWVSTNGRCQSKALCSWKGQKYWPGKELCDGSYRQRCSSSGKWIRGGRCSLHCRKGPTPYAINSKACIKGWLNICTSGGQWKRLSKCKDRAGCKHAGRIYPRGTIKCFNNYIRYCAGKSWQRRGNCKGYCSHQGKFYKSGEMVYIKGRRYRCNNGRWIK